MSPKVSEWAQACRGWLLGIELHVGCSRSPGRLLREPRARTGCRPRRSRSRRRLCTEHVEPDIQAPLAAHAVDVLAAEAVGACERSTVIAAVELKQAAAGGDEHGCCGPCWLDACRWRA